MNVQVSSQDPATVVADALVVNLFEGEDPAGGELAPLDRKLDGLLSRLGELKELPDKVYRTAVHPTLGRTAAPRLVLVGSGKRSDFTVDRARNAAGAAARAMLERQVSSLAFWFTGISDAMRAAEVIANGAVLATFDPGELKKKDENGSKELADLTILSPDGNNDEVLAAGAARGRILGEAANLTRHLANTPGNLLSPLQLASEATRAGADAGFAVEILDRDRMAALGMGALLGVAQGSDQPPALIVMRFPGRGGDGWDLALIGKGVTFDTGGISIKPAAEMHVMKEDMSAGAATIGAMSAIARLKVRANVLGIVPAVENMPSGHSMRPGDVLTALNGKTIEVLNTDAEGRLILADAIGYAQRLGAKRLVDAATLTGAIIVALGHEAAGLFGTPQEWVDQVRAAGEATGERLWQLPLYDEYLEPLKSQIADVANVGGRAAGAITAAMFIRQFAEEGVAWAHLDVAGTSWADDEKPYLARGPTGFPVRTFVALAEALAKKADGP